MFFASQSLMSLQSRAIKVSRMIYLLKNNKKKIAKSLNVKKDWNKKDKIKTKKLKITSCRNKRNFDFLIACHEIKIDEL